MTPSSENRTKSIQSLATPPGRHRHPYPSAPAPAVSARHGAHRASAPTRHHTVWTGPIPATVWACGPVPIDPDARWPTAILTKIVTSFSVPGDRVILLHGPARTGGLTDHSPAVEYDAELATALAAINDLHRAPRMIHLGLNAMASGSASQSLCADQLSTSDSAHSPRIDPVPGSTPDAAAIRQDTATADADLIITSLHPQHSGSCIADYMTLLAARLLPVGGLLAVLTHSDWSSGELLDPTGPLVAGAQHADLLYLQHVVALHTRIRDGQPPSATTVTTTPSARGRGFVPPHRRVSSDVLVFAQPRSPAGSGELSGFQLEPTGGSIGSLGGCSWVRDEPTVVAS
jgi:hypothetical protein